MSQADEYIRNANAEEDRLVETLLASPVVIIDGVVWPRTATGGKRQKQTQWTLQLWLDAWRELGQPLQTNRLTVIRRVFDKELRTLTAEFGKLETVRIQARLLIDREHDERHAWLERIEGHSLDSEVLAALERFRQPISFDDPALGRFTYDRRGEQFEASVSWLGQEIRLTCDTLCGQANIPTEAIEKARVLWKERAKWDRRVREYATSELLESRNQSCLEELEYAKEQGEDVVEEELRAVDAEEFQRRIRLESVSVNADGSFCFWFDDDNLFGGHAVQIAGSLEGGFKFADTPG